MEEEKDKCLKAGMNDHVGKPFQERELCAILRKWIPAAETDGTLDLTATGDKKDFLPLDTLKLGSINVRMGLNYSSGDQERFVERLLRYAETHENIAVDLRRALALKEHDLLKNMIHTIKGTAPVLGAISLARLAEKLERSMSSAELPETMAAELAIGLEELLTDIAKIRELQQGRTPPSYESRSTAPVIDRVNVAQILRDLNQCMEADMKQADRLIRVLDGLLNDTPYRAILMTLRRDMDDFEIESAMTNLGNLASALEIDLT
jgi:two-component system sensor histidine kinase/response regulator